MAVVMQSAVRVPTPEPEIDTGHGHDATSNDPGSGPGSARKRTRTSRSPSPHRQAPSLRHRSPSRSPRRGNGYQRDAAPPSSLLTAEEKQAAAKAEYQKLLTMRSGGTYVPPARLRALQAEIGNDPQSPEFQRMAWEALKKSINGLINKVNVSNIKHIVPELFGENLIRGRGLFCRSIMKAQAASLPFTPIYAAMAAIVNTKLPQVGELLMNRLIVQFRKAYRRNDKSVCLSSITFLAHLINQQVVHEKLAFHIILLLLNKPTDDSVEIAVGLMKEVGQHIEEQQVAVASLIYDQFRNILHEADIDKRVQYMIEVLFQIRRDGYKDNPAVKEELDLVEEEDQITHQNVDLEGPREVLDTLNIFKFDAQWEEHEQAYKELKAEILGEASDDEDDEDEDEDALSEEEEAQDQQQREVEIRDQSNVDLVNLRRTIYLTIMSSGGFEECTHKLLRINLPPGLEHEMPSMLIECASQERTFGKFFGLIGERLCKLNRMWIDLFDEQFAKYYETIHRFETNRLRIIAQFFAHLLSSDAINWQALSVIHLNEEETTSSSRIFIKILFEDLSQTLGMKKLQDRMADPMLQPSLTGLYPTENPRDTRFSINFFTAIGMGALTEGMREWLKNAPKPAAPALPAPTKAPSVDSRSTSRSSYSSYSSYSSRSRSRSRSRTPVRKSRGRGQSYSRSPSPIRRGGRRGRSLSDSRSRSRSPPARRARSSRSPSRSCKRGSVANKSGRRRSYSPSVSRSPSSRPMRGRDARTRSYTPSISRSRSPVPRDAKRKAKRSGRHRSLSTSDSRSPPRRRGTSVSRSRSRSRSRARDVKGSSRLTRRSISRSRSRGRGKAVAGRSRSPYHSRSRSGSRSRSYSRSRSRSPRRGAYRSSRRSRSPPRARYRRNTSSVASIRSRTRTRARARSLTPSRSRSRSRSRSHSRRRSRSRSRSQRQSRTNKASKRHYDSKSRSRSRSSSRLRSRSGSRSQRRRPRARGSERQDATATASAATRAPVPPRAPAAVPAAAARRSVQDDESGIHPSRRALVGGLGMNS